MYFQSTGSLTQASVLRGAGVMALSHDDENVSRTLSVLGGLYACRNPLLLRVDAEEKRSIMSIWVQQKSVVTMKLKRPEASEFNPTLLSALLLAVIELLLDSKDGTFQWWLQRISTFLRRQRGNGDIDPLGRALTRFFDFLNVLLAIANLEPPMGAETPVQHLPSRSIAVPEHSDEDRIDEMLSSLWHWARLQARMMKWTADAEGQNLVGQADSQKSWETANAKVQGLDIVCEASALQARIIEDLLLLSRRPTDQVSICITPYYHWALIGLSHRLQHPAWNSLMCELPVMPAEVLHQQALDALGCVETLVRQSGLDVALYLPLCITIAPVFFSAAIYVLLSQTINFLDRSVSRFSPRLYYWTFIPVDIVSLVLQAVGGALSSVGTTKKDVDTGVNISLAGLVLQVVSLLVFCGLFADYMISYIRLPSRSEMSMRLKVFLSFLGLSTVLILLRCVYRIVELHEGYFSHWFRDEPLFIGLESVVMSLAVFCLHIGHPEC
ncbi:Sphingoid long-chain base transporter RSB1-like protein 2 [Colletotrichum chlorophyti]|uniref:Sphingoid long-chain base transporter RSB1-like protein 2 n=1 Tax=Colletotrichum chlorophyti TaxID=708187 RepID=A0A1Q8S571_9PEZI|nr:Sphingoid long-chain base transporter RSB1-like protein 2 [Colletotrichum chlorophyti]